jgi:hypothetical protein
LKRGALPGWYQDCGDEMVSVTSPRGQAGILPEAWCCLVPRCPDGAELAVGEGERADGAGSALMCGRAEPAVPAPGGTAWPAVELAVSIPLTSQPRPVSTPTPAPRMTTRRRQYVAGESFAARARPSCRRPAVCGGFWPTSLSMWADHRN